MKLFLNGPNIKKEKTSKQDKDACLAICVLRALIHYGIEETKENFYKICECKGDGNLALPWGVCKGAAKYGKYISHVSKHPSKLIDYGELMEKGPLSKPEAIDFVKGLINYCLHSKLSNYIELVKWQDSDEDFIFDILKNQYGLFIPTLRWDEKEKENHSVIVTGIDDNQNIYFYNPNNGGEEHFSYDDFIKKWLNSYTDNDFFIVSDKPINVKERRKLRKS